MLQDENSDLKNDFNRPRIYLAKYVEAFERIESNGLIIIQVLTQYVRTKVYKCIHFGTYIAMYPKFLSEHVTNHIGANLLADSDFKPMLKA